MFERGSRDDATIDALNELLRGELSAVESYDKALPVVEGRPVLENDLHGCRASHETRAARLRRAILDAGGEPARASGAWGLFARSVTKGSGAFGWKAVIDTLEQGEDHGLKEYEGALERLDLPSRALVAGELLPLQQHTRDLVTALKRVTSP
jgi:hypothetical protein